MSGRSGIWGICGTFAGSQIPYGRRRRISVYCRAESEGGPGKRFQRIPVRTVFLEILPKGIDKAQRLEVLLGILGISREEMIACGDGYNDLTMIKYAGLGVAMENAVFPVRKAADYITASNNEDGVALVVEKFLLS